MLRRTTKANPVSEPNWPRNDIAISEEVFEMGRKYYESNNYLWAEMIACCTRAKRTDIATRVYEQWREMRERVGMDGGLVVMEAMIAHYAHAKRPNMVAVIYDHIKDANLVPSAYSISALAKSFCLYGETDKAEELMKRQDDPSQLSWVLTNQLINSMCRHGKIDDAVATLNDSARLGFAPTQETYNNLVMALARANHPQTLQSVLDTMGGSMNEQTYRMMLLGFANAEEGKAYSSPTITKLWKEVVAKFPVLDPRTVSAVCLAYLRNRDVNNAIAIISPRLTKHAFEFQVWDTYIRIFRQGLDGKDAEGDYQLQIKLEHRLMAAYRMMRINFERHGDTSRYALYRWRDLHTLVLEKIRDPESVETIYKDIVASNFFLSPHGDDNPDAIFVKKRIIGDTVRIFLGNHWFEKIVPMYKEGGTSVMRKLNSHFRRIFANSPESECLVNFDSYLKIGAICKEHNVPDGELRTQEFLSLIQYRFPKTVLPDKQ